MKQIFVGLALTILIVLVAGNAFLGSNGATGASIKDMITGEPTVVTIGLDQGGYVPREITVKANQPVTLKNDGSLVGCAQYPVQPEIGMAADFSKSDEYTFTPTKKGKFSFTCGMGMWKGTINVV